MKKLISRTIARTLAVALASAFSFQLSALAQVPGTTPYQPNFYTQLTNWSGVWIKSNSVGVVSTAYQYSTNQQVTLRQGVSGGDSWLAVVTTTNGSVGNITIAFAESQDSTGTNWSTWPNPLSWSFSLSGYTNNQVAITNFPHTSLTGNRFIFPYAVTNSCTTNWVQIQLIQEGHSNQ